MSQTCTSGRAAEILGVTPRTIQLWSESGILEFTKTLGGHRRYDLKHIQQLAETLGNKTESHETENQSPSSSTKILIIEDDAALLNLYRLNILSWNLPVRVELSSDGYDGLVKIGKFSPDILILDLTLPQLDGFQIIATLMKNKLLESMKLIVVTGMTDATTSEVLTRLADILILHKPVQFEDLRQQIESYLDTTRPN